MRLWYILTVGLLLEVNGQALDVLHQSWTRRIITGREINGSSQILIGLLSFASPLHPDFNLRNSSFPEFSGKLESLDLHKSEDRQHLSWWCTSQGKLNTIQNLILQLAIKDADTERWCSMRPHILVLVSIGEATERNDLALEAVIHSTIWQTTRLGDFKNPFIAQDDECSREKRVEQSVFLETAATGIGGMLNTVMKGMLGDVINQVMEGTLGQIAQDATSTIQHNVLGGVPSIVGRVVGQALANNLSNMLVDALTNSLSTRLATTMTNRIGPSLSVGIAERLEPRLLLQLETGMRYELGKKLDNGLEAVLERSLQAILVEKLTNSLTHALVPVLTMLLQTENHDQSVRDAEQASCAICFVHQEHHSECSNCRFSSSSVMQDAFSSSYYSDYFGSYYASYYSNSMDVYDKTVMVDENGKTQAG